MRVRLLLANAAQVQSNMLHALGIGWTEIGPDPSPFAIAAVIETPWDETNRLNHLRFEIVDVDGQPLLVPTPMGDRPFELSADFTGGRPAAAPAGITFITPVAINVQPLPFESGRQYLIRAHVNNQLMDETGFRVRPRPPAPRPPTA